MVGNLTGEGIVVYKLSRYLANTKLISISPTIVS